MSVVQEYNKLVAKVKSAYASAVAGYQYVTTFISDEPLDYGSLSLGIGAGMIAGGRVLAGGLFLAAGYYMRNKARVTSWFVDPPSNEGGAAS